MSGYYINGRGERVGVKPFDKEAHERAEIARKGKAVAAHVPAQWVTVLRLLDRTTQKGPYRYERDVQHFGLMYAMQALGLVAGAGGASASSFDEIVWLTPLGQAVVDAARTQENRG